MTILTSPYHSSSARLQHTSPGAVLGGDRHICSWHRCVARCGAQHLLDGPSSRGCCSPAWASALPIPPFARVRSRRTSRAERKADGSGLSNTFRIGGLATGSAARAVFRQRSRLSMYGRGAAQASRLPGRRSPAISLGGHKAAAHGNQISPTRARVSLRLGCGTIFVSARSSSRSVQSPRMPRPVQGLSSATRSPPAPRTAPVTTTSLIDSTTLAPVRRETATTAVPRRRRCNTPKIASRICSPPDKNSMNVSVRPPILETDRSASSGTPEPARRRR